MSQISDQPRPKRSSSSRARAASATRERASGEESGSEREMATRSHALAERVKELNCLHSLSTLLENRRADLGDILQRIVDLIPCAWQAPDRACARIAIRSRRYESRGQGAPRRAISEAVVIGGEAIGSVEVGYREVDGSGDGPAFLDEERRLLGTIAERVAEIVAFKETERQLATYQEHLRSLASELAMAEERERRQLAIALHDRIGQGLAVTRLKLETLQHLLPAEHQGRLADISTLVKQIIDDTRSLTFDISPPILYELGLRPAVSWLGDHFRRQLGLDVDVRAENLDGELDEGVRIMLFRSVQELLANVVKHARARRALVTLRSADRGVEVLVEDDGVGFDVERRSSFPAATGGFGLFSIRERIGHLGGAASVESRPGRGTRVRLWVPRLPSTAQEAGRS